MLKKTVEALASTHVVVGGGGLLPDLPQLLLPRTIFYMGIKLLGKPLILHGQTVELSVLVRPALRMASALILRDQTHSREAALNHGVRSDQIFDGYDPAMFLTPATATTLEEALRGAFKTSSVPSFIAVSLKNSKSRAWTRELLERFAHTITKFLRQADLNHVALVPMQSHPNTDDWLLANQLSERLDFTQVVVLPEGLPPQLAKGIFGKAVLTISCRYHAAVFSLSSGVPCIGLCVSERYDHKLNGIFSQFGVQQFWAPLNLHSLDGLLERLLEIYRNRHRYREHLLKKLAELQRLGEQQHRFIP